MHSMKSHVTFYSMFHLSSFLQRSQCCYLQSALCRPLSSYILQQFKLLHKGKQAPNLRSQFKKFALCRNVSAAHSCHDKLNFNKESARHLSYSACLSVVDKSVSAPLTKRQAQDLILRLTGEERNALLCALQEFESEKLKAEYEGQLAGTRWRSKFGRPSKLPRLGDVDPTGAYCHLPEDWLARKHAETVPPPSSTELWQVGVHNALPFVGFGFLDNFFMIIAGDYIEMTMGTMMVLSTMAAAALGNTISDILGIGSAWYVERVATRIGVRAPELTPVQLDMKSSRWASNMGRVVGVTIGCLLGMFPLIFLNHPTDTPAAPSKEETPV